jgi:hypothetical protein
VARNPFAELEIFRRPAKTITMDRMSGNPGGKNQMVRS